jgi:hypothetical protein
MKRFKFLSLLLVCFALVGCIDDRIKRASSVVNAKTQVAAKEFAAAPTDPAKVEVAKRYFDNAPALTQVLDDYLAGRKPAPVVVPASVPASAPMPAPASATVPAPAVKPNT